MTFTWSFEVVQAAWWTRVLHPVAQDVGSVVPDVFPAYARLFHPVHDGRGARTWADVAAQNDRIVHPEMQFHAISRPRGEPWPDGYDMANAVDWGSLPLRELELLAGTLAPHTTTSDRSWWCVWDGYGILHSGAGFTRPPVAPPQALSGPRVSIPYRDYYLLRGACSCVRELYEHLWNQSPNVWWPDDRAWFVATEIDFAWTYVAGSTAAVDAVLAHPDLEALPATPADQFTYDSDSRNGALDGPEP